MIPTQGLKTILEKNPNLQPTVAEIAFQTKLLAKYQAKDLIGKKIGNKRGGVNNIHTWDFDYLGSVSEDEKDLLDNLITERRKNKYAIAHGTPDKDGIPLTEEEIKTFYSGKTGSLSSVLSSLVSKGYLNKKSSGYDIAGGKLSFPYANILDPESVAPIIVASDADRLAIAEGNKLRRLTETEFKRLFGFKDTFKIPEDVSQRAVFDLFGNSVVIPMAKAVTALLFA